MMSVPLKVWVFLCHMAEANASVGWTKIRAAALIDEMELPVVEEGKIVTVDYTNHKGQRRDRRIQVIEFWHGESPYHPGKRYFCKALDLDAGEVRDFALGAIHEWRDDHDEANQAVVPAVRPNVQAS